MWVRALLTIAVTLLASGLSAGQAYDAACPLDFDYELSSAAQGDSVLVRFIVNGRNGTGEDAEICGLFYLSGFYQPAERKEARCRSWPMFLVIDDTDVTPCLDCEPMVIPHGGVLSDTLSFDYKPAYFDGNPGAIELSAHFRYGRPGMPWNDAARAGGDRMRVAIPVP